MINLEDLPELMTPKEVAKVLRVHVTTVYNLIRQGNLLASRIGKGYRINKSDLLLYIRDNYGHKSAQSSI